MSASILDLVRPELRKLRGYSSARLEATGGRILLNANESPWPTEDGVNRYPEPQPAALRERLASLYDVPADHLLLSRGSDEAIDLLTRAFCRAALDAVLVMPPTFGMYAVCAEIQGAAIARVPLAPETFAVDVDLVAQRALSDPSIRLVYVCTPNNPTGGIVPRDDVLKLARALAGRALVVVDEAYVEFAGVGSLAPEVVRGENLVVLRTLSKAYGLAGARIGALVATPDLVMLLRRIMPPYPLPTPSVECALAALDEAGVARAEARVAAACDERERVRHRLDALACVERTWASRTNFVLVRFADAERAYWACLERGVVLRDVSGNPGLEGCLRVSIGTPAENDAMLAVLAEVPVDARENAEVSR